MNYPTHSQRCAEQLVSAQGLSRRDLLLGAAAALSLAGSRAAATAPPPPHRIDVHFHLLPPQYVTEAPSTANEVRPFGRTPEAMLEDMDRSGLATGMLSFPTPSYWFSGVEAGRHLARFCNDYYAAVVQRHPKRFGLFAGVPPLGDTEGVLREIAYAYDSLGADGIAVTTSYGGNYLGDAAFDPVWQELNRRKAVVFVHPVNPACCTAVNDGVTAGYGEWPFDTARTVMSLWVRDALTEWPNIRFIFSHGGGGLPMIADRIDKFGRPGPKGSPPVHDALTFISKLYFDVANAAGPSALPAVRGMADPRHVLFGSDYPFIPTSRGIDYLARAGLSREDLFAIERGNALALLPRLRELLANSVQ
jgi:predicted TIM-barrel fold metal-dependent hydrolase